MILSASLTQSHQTGTSSQSRGYQPGRGLPAQKGIKLSWLRRVEDEMAKPSLLTTTTSVGLTQPIPRPRTIFC